MKTTPEMSRITDAEVNKTTLARFLDCSTPYVDTLIKQSGFPTFKRGGTYPLLPTVVWYIQQLKAKETDQTTESARKIRVEREIKELHLMQLRGDLVKMADVYAELSKPFAAARGRLLGLARQIAPQVTGMKSTVEAEQIIDKYINDILNEWAAGINGGDGGASVVPNAQTTTKVDHKPMGGSKQVPKRGGKRGKRKMAHRSR